jgi:hypothetical protein
MNAQAHSLRFYGPLPSPSQSNPASELGNELKNLFLVATEHARNNATDWRTLTRALIEEVALECQAPGWDGYGAQPISLNAKAEAQRLVDLLPFWLSAPDPVPDPDGEIALSWDLAPGHVFTLSVNSNGVLSYAGLLGDGVKRHGVEPFKSDVPKAILEAIEELHDRCPSIG